MASRGCSGCTPALPCHVSLRVLNLPHITMPSCSHLLLGLCTRRNLTWSSNPPPPTEPVPSEANCYTKPPLACSSIPASPAPGQHVSNCPCHTMPQQLPPACMHRSCRHNSTHIQQHTLVCSDLEHNFAVPPTWLSMPSTNTAVLIVLPQLRLLAG